MGNAKKNIQHNINGDQSLNSYNVETDDESSEDSETKPLSIRSISKPFCR